jgi:hypothetical protein
MFLINHRYTRNGYEYCELVVHCNITLYRRMIGDGDNWEVQLCTGKWEEEDILNEIITELFDSVPDGYSWINTR